ncbi:MAG: hypothetical protein H6Q19_1874 [Bacteroidetes bacterium]|nr:hypothetical protein [Bacteroidota bacterium]
MKIAFSFKFQIYYSENKQSRFLFDGILTDKEDDD